LATQIEERYHALTGSREKDAFVGGNGQSVVFGNVSDTRSPTADWRTVILSGRPMTKSDAYRMIGRRAMKAGMRRRSVITPSGPRG
jgi:hypothetical protein